MTEIGRPKLISSMPYYLAIVEGSMSCPDIFGIYSGIVDRQLMNAKRCCVVEVGKLQS